MSTATTEKLTNGGSDPALGNELVFPEPARGEATRTLINGVLVAGVLSATAAPLLEDAPANAQTVTSVAYEQGPAAEAATHEPRLATVTIRRGDTEIGFAKETHKAAGLSERQDLRIIETHNAQPPRDLQIGSELVIPEAGLAQPPHQATRTEHVRVEEGDTYIGFAKEVSAKTGIPEETELQAIEQANDEPARDLQIGSELVIPDGPGSAVGHPAAQREARHHFKDEVVQDDDTYDGLLAAVGTSPTEENVEISAKASGVEDPDLLMPGEHVKVLLTKHAHRHSADRDHAPKTHNAKHQPTPPETTPPPTAHQPEAHHHSAEQAHEKTHQSIHEQHKQLERLKLDIDGYHGDTWTKHQLHEVQRLLPIYMKAAAKHNIPWQMLAVLHLREHDLSLSNPDNDQGVYQDYSGGHDYTPGPISMQDFEAQTMHAAALLAHDYAPRTDGIVPGHLSFNSGNLKKIAATFYAYNGMAYGSQAEAIGYDSPEDAFQGSPYVMNLASSAQNSSTNPDWGQIVYDNGGMEPANQIPGAWLLFRDLVNITPGARHITNADLDANSDVETAPPVVAPIPPAGQGETPPAPGSPETLSAVQQELTSLAQTDATAWEQNNYSQPDGQDPTSAYINQPGSPPGFWCAYWFTNLAKKANVPFANNFYWGRVSTLVEAVKNGNGNGWTWHAADSGYQPQPGDAVIHAYGDSKKPDHINMYTPENGKIELTGGDQINPKIGYYDTAENAAVTTYAISSLQSDSIVGYFSPPDQATMPTAPQAPTSPQPTVPTTGNTSPTAPSGTDQLPAGISR